MATVYLHGQAEDDAGFDITFIIPKDGNEKVKYYTSAKKLDEMIKVLDKQRYVSFIN